MTSRTKRCPRIRVAGVAVRNGKLLVVEHRRDGRSYYLLPGGGLEWGESCAAGLAREFEEELSLRIAVGRLLVINESIEPRGRRHILNLAFQVRVLGGRMQVHRDPRLRSAQWLSPRELMRVEFHPEIRQPILDAWRRGFKTGLGMTPTPWT